MTMRRSAKKKRVVIYPTRDQEVLTATEVSELLRLHRSTVYKLVSEGRIPGFRLATEWRFRRDLVVSWMAVRSTRQVQNTEASAERVKSLVELSRAHINRAHKTI